MMKRSVTRRLLCLLLAALLSAPAALAEYRPLSVGDSGADVTTLKERLYELGYFTRASYGETYTKNTAEKIRKFASKYGLDSDTATPELQALLFAEDARPESYVPMSGPASVGPDAHPELPPLNEDGTLADKAAEPFLYKNEEAGLWIYISGTLSIEIRRYDNRIDNILWFETRVRLSGGNRIKTIFSDDRQSGKAFAKPLKIVQKHQAVLAFSDDFFGWRRSGSDVEGIIVREGTIYSDKTRANRKFPPLDIIAAMPDGTLKTFAPDAHTAQEYLDMGVLNTWAFGPTLVSGGQVSTQLDFAANSASQPRQAMGMLAPNDYIFLTVTGRRKDSDGATIQWLANRMAGLGAQEAINLDGGNSVMLVFDGEMLNKVKGISASSIRDMVSMIAFFD